MSSIKKRNAPAEDKNQIVGGTLYLVGTPLGNLADLSARALKVLSEVDFIAAEDTRNTGKLLAYFDISKPQVSYFEHNKRQRGEYIVSRLEAGESCALVTDAGMPAISDPGEDLVALCAEKNIPVTAVPGPCAAITALALSGLPSGRFSFEGFLSTNKAERNKRLEEIKHDKRTLILYEAPHKLCDTLADLLKAFGNRRISLCRELTKLNEEVIRTDLEGAVAMYADKAPRGEFVLILDGSTDDAPEAKFFDNMSVTEHVEHYIAGGMERMDAIKAAAKDRGVPKNEIYKEYLPSKPKNF